MADDPQIETPPAVGDVDPSGLTQPGELHLTTAVRRPVELHPGDNQIAEDFLAGRALAQRTDVAAKWDAIGKPPPAAQATPGAVEGAAEGATATQLPSIATGPASQGLLSTGAKLLSAIGSGAVATAKDVGVGIADAPRQVLGGTLDFGNNLMRFADDVVKQAEQSGMPNAYFRLFDKDGNWSPQIESADAFHQAQAEGKDDVFQVPTTGGPDTITGNVIRTGTTFMLGRGSAAGPLASATGGLGIGGQAIRDFISGAVGQNANQPRLSNIIDQVMPNFVTDFLKAKSPGEEDALLGHLKSGLEYAGLGLSVEGIKKIATSMKSALKGEGADIFNIGEGGTGSAGPAGDLSAAQEVSGPVQPSPLTLGDPAAPYTQIRIDQETQALAEKYLAGEGGENPVKLNLARIGSGDDIKAALAEISKTIPAQGVQSNDATVMLADALGKRPQDYLSGQVQGSALNAQEAVAARMMLDSSAQQLIDYAKAASDLTTGTPEAKAAFLRAFATHRAIQLYVEGARAEAGRALQSWSIISSTRSNYAQAVQQLVSTADAGGDLTNMAQRIAEVGDALKAGRLVSNSFAGTARDGLLKVYYNILLSNPKTVIKKLVSDAGQAMWNLTTTYGAEKFGSGAVPPGETAALFWGYANSVKDAIRLAGKGLKAGESQFYRDYQSMDGLGTSRLSALANGSPVAIGDEDAAVAATSYLRSALPTSWIGAADDFAKYLNYRAEVSRFAYRAAVNDGLEPGTEEFATQIAQTLDDVPPALHQQAIANALKTTFQDPLSGISQWLQEGADKINLPLPHTDFQVPLGRILLPFVRVPANIAKWSYYNSPLALLSPNSVVKSELAQGGATADLARAKIYLGSAVALGFADLALNNVMTGKGPTDPQLQRAWRAAGNEPYSIQLSKLGGPFKDMPPVGYNQVEPFGLMGSAIADSFGIMKFAKDDGRENIAASLMFGIGNAMMSKTYFQSVADFFEALNSPERDGQRWSDNLLASVVPQGVVGLSRAMDEWQRAHYGLIDGIEARLPMVSKGLPPARNFWGDPIPQRDAFLPFLSNTGAARMLSPVPLGRRMPVEPIDQWIWENRMEFPRGSSNYLGISTPSQVQSFASPDRKLSAQIPLTPEELDRFKVLAGHELKDPRTGLGARDYLNALVQQNNPDTGSQRQWDNGSPAERALMVQSVVNKFRAAAKQQLPREFPDLASSLAAGWDARKQQLQGTAPKTSGALTP